MNWLLIWAGLLIVVLYSPIGSPELYTSKTYLLSYQNYVPYKSSILNSSKIKQSPSFNSDEPDMPDLNLPSKSNYSVENHPLTRISGQRSSYSIVQSQSYLGNNYSPGAMTGGSTPFLAGRNSRNSAGTTGDVVMNETTTYSTLSNLNNSTTKQSVTALDTPGGTDPGGDPGGDPIPVGEGWAFFVFLGIVYTIFRSGIVQTRFHNK